MEVDYILVYFHYGLRSSNKPSLKWLREAYGEFDRKYGEFSDSEMGERSRRLSTHCSQPCWVFGE